MAGIASALCHFITFTTLYNAVATKNTRESVAQKLASTDVVQLRVTLQRLPQRTWLCSLPEAQCRISREISNVEIEFDAWARGDVLRRPRSAPIRFLVDCVNKTDWVPAKNFVDYIKRTGWAPGRSAYESLARAGWAALLLITTSITLPEADRLGERAFISRNIAYVILIGIPQVQWLLSPYASAAAYKRLNRQLAATIHVSALLYALVAFIPACRFLYDQVWFAILNVVLSACWVYCFQFHWRVQWWRDRRRIRAAATNTNPPPEPICEELTAIELDVAGFLALSDNKAFKGGHLHTIQDSLIRGGLQRIVETLRACLSKADLSKHEEAVRHLLEARSQNDLGAVLSPRVARRNRSVERSTKIIVSTPSALLLAAFIIPLFVTRQWMSAGQACIFTFSVITELWILALSPDITPEAYADFYTPRILTSILAFAHVNVPLLWKHDVFLDDQWFWGTNAALIVEVLILADPAVKGLLFLAKRRSRKLWETETTHQEERSRVEQS